MIKRKIMGAIVGYLLIAQTLEARNNAALFGVAAATIVGAAIIADAQSKPPPDYYDEPEPREHYTERKKVKKRQAAVVITSEMKIQQSLLNMGLYQGKIDGKLNSYTSRTAIKNLNTKYEISDESSLDSRTRDQLLYLAELYQMDLDLFAEGDKKIVAGKRLQTALKVHGVYFDPIDGVIGNGTRKAIATYKIRQGLTPSITLSPSETEELINSAQEMNTKAIDEAITGLTPREQVAHAAEASPQHQQEPNTRAQMRSDGSAASDEAAREDISTPRPEDKQEVLPSSSEPAVSQIEEKNGSATPNAQ